MNKLTTALIFTFIGFISLIVVKAQKFIPLYDNNVLNSKPKPIDFQEDFNYSNNNSQRIGNVYNPGLYIYKATNPTGTAVIICPGGGYTYLALDKEGHDVAKRFQEMGITAFVLKYRLPDDLIMEDKSIVPLQDALQAIYWVRKNASSYDINPNHIGIMGFSAGGHLASSASVHYADAKIQNKENISLRPNFSILIYPVITFGEFTHIGSVKRLLGNEPTDIQRKYFSSELQVNAQTPPAFMVHANNDKVVPIQNSINYNLALLKYNIPSELHIYQAGGHGFGLNNRTTKDQWWDRMRNWLQANKF